jgi:hypothetical protein
VNLYEICSYKLIGKLTVFFPLGVQVVQHDRGGFHYHRTEFSDHLDAKTGSILGKVSSLRFILNIDGSPIISKSHTHPSHSQTSHLLTSSLSLGVPVPRPTQCIQDM